MELQSPTYIKKEISVKKNNINPSLENEEEQVINQLIAKYNNYKAYIGSAQYSNNPASRHGFVFGNKTNGIMFIIAIVILNLITILALTITKTFHWTMIILGIIYVFLHVLFIKQIIFNFKENHYIEKTKAHYADNFELTTRGYDHNPIYVINYEITTIITGTIKQNASLSKETFDFLKTQNQLPVELYHGNGFEYSINYAKIQKVKKQKKF